MGIGKQEVAADGMRQGARLHMRGAEVQDIHITLTQIHHLIKLLKEWDQFRCLWIEGQRVGIKMGKLHAVHWSEDHLRGQTLDEQAHYTTA